MAKLTQTQALVKGLEAEGWQATQTRSGKKAYTRPLKLKSGQEVDCWMFVGGGASLRMSVGSDLFGQSRAMPGKAARLIALGLASTCPDALLSELEGV